ncbi:hypothetical protein CWI39_3539p0010, partial [Hamiltosporidium magnivora]
PVYAGCTPQSSNIDVSLYAICIQERPTSLPAPRGVIFISSSRNMGDGCKMSRSYIKGVSNMCSKLEGVSSNSVR